MTQKINRHSRGVFIIAATPFSEAGELDLDSTDRLLDFYLDSGVDGITILGIMGEAPKLSGLEASQFSQHVLKRIDHRIPVVVGVSTAGLANMAAIAHESMDSGAAGVMVAPIPGLATEIDVKRYFTSVCEHLGPDVPVCLQDYPQANGVRMSVDTILSLSLELPQLVMLKHEDWPGLNKLSQIRKRCDNTDFPGLSILTGNSALFLPQELQRGADGAMTGFAYPEMLVQVVKQHNLGNIDRAEDIFDAYLPLVRHEQQLGAGLAIRKEVLRRRGVLASARTRAPGPSLSELDHAELTRLINRLEKRLTQLEIT